MTKPMTANCSMDNNPYEKHGYGIHYKKSFLELGDVFYDGQNKGPTYIVIGLESKGRIVTLCIHEKLTILIYMGPRNEADGFVDLLVIGNILKAIDGAFERDVESGVNRLINRVGDFNELKRFEDVKE